MFLFCLAAAAGPKTQQVSFIPSSLFFFFFDGISSVPRPFLSFPVNFFSDWRYHLTGFLFSRKRAPRPSTSPGFCSRPFLRFLIFTAHGFSFFSPKVPFWKLWFSPLFFPRFRRAYVYFSFFPPDAFSPPMQCVIFLVNP